MLNIIETNKLDSIVEYRNIHRVEIMFPMFIQHFEEFEDSGERNDSSIFIIKENHDWRISSKSLRDELQ